MKPPKLEDVFPLLGLEHDILLSRQGDLTLGFEVQLPELFSLSDQDYETLHLSWVRALRLLPDNCVFHKQDWFTENRYQGNFTGPDQSFLNTCSERYFHERPYQDHACFILLTQRTGSGNRGFSPLIPWLGHSPVPRPTLNREFMEGFQDLSGQFRSTLEDGGLLQLRRMKGEDLYSGTGYPGLVERYCFLLFPGSGPLVQDIGLRDGLRVGDRNVLMYSLADPADMPSHCGPRVNAERYSTDRTKLSLGLASPLGQLLSCNHLYNQFIFRENIPRVLSRLEQKRLRLHALSAYSRRNAVARDATHGFLQEAFEEQHLAVKAHFNIMAWGFGDLEIKELKNRISTAISQLEAVPRQETFGAARIFWAGLPGNEGSFPLSETMDTFAEQASCFLNQEGPYRTSLGSQGLRLGDRLDGRPLLVDLSDGPLKSGIITNRNKFVLGPSGSGKSFFTNHMVRTYLEQGAHVVLVDVGHSYESLCELKHGYYFTYEENNPIRFNPFYLEGGGAPVSEKKESIKALLLALWKKEDESYSRSEYVALSEALQEYYRMQAQPSAAFPCFDSFYEYVRDSFSLRLQNDQIQQKDMDIRNFLYVLRPYYQGGEFDYLLNARENLDLLDQPFIVFELDHIKDHPILFPVVTLIIMEVFIAKMRRLKGIRKIILIEEAWKAIAKAGMAEYIRYLFKTVRKFYGEAVVVTQEIEDIIHSPVVRHSILHNADCKILLDQSKYLNRFGEVQELLGLHDQEKALILSLNKANDPKLKYKEVFISLGGQISRVYRTEVSPEEYLAYTTEESEKIRVNRLSREWKGYREAALKRLASEQAAPKFAISSPPEPGLPESEA